MKFPQATVDGRRVALAATKAAWEAGLSNTDKGPGMLFVFPEPRRWPVWMKEMRFDLDVYWLDADGTIVERATLPKDYRPVQFPKCDCWSVLEVPAGETSYRVGQRVEITQPHDAKRAAHTHS